MSGDSRRANEWLENHGLVWFAVAAAVTGLAYTLAQVWVGGQSFAGAAPLGAAFGVAFAATSVLARRILGG